MQRIGIFCGSNFGNSQAIINGCKEIIQQAVHKHLGIVYGGASVGLMGLIADEALKNNLEVIGVIPESMMTREIAHPGLTRLDVVKTMHERKKRMYELSDIFVALPGGLGTLDELFEIITWKQINIHDKPIGLWNLSNYFDDLIKFLEKSKNMGFVSQELSNLLIIESSIDSLLNKMLMNK